MTLTLLLVVTACVLPSVIVYLTLRFVPRGPHRAYPALVGISLLGTVTAIALEYAVTTALPSDAQQVSPVTYSLLAAAVPEQVSKVGALLLWLSFQTKRSVRDALVGAVIAAMVFDACEGFLLFAAASHGDLPTWLQTVAAHSALSTLPSAINAAVVGICVAASLGKTWARGATTVIGSLFVVVTANTLWSLAMILFTNHWSNSDRWFWVLAGSVPLILTTLAIQLAAIAFGLSSNPTLAPPQRNFR
jgi:hypothetical protein